MALSAATIERGSPLTPRQREVLRLQAYGFSHREISEQLGLSIWTVKNHHKQAVRSLQSVLRVSPSDRVRTSLACYVMGLLDAGVSAPEIVQRLRDATPTTTPKMLPTDEMSRRPIPAETTVLTVEPGSGPLVAESVSLASD